SRDSLSSACISGPVGSRPFSLATWAATSLIGTSRRLRRGSPLIIGARWLPLAVEAAGAGALGAAGAGVGADGGAADAELEIGVTPGTCLPGGMVKVGMPMMVAGRGGCGTDGGGVLGALGAGAGTFGGVA